MSEKKQQPLPFVYQFAAGAVAGVSEVSLSDPENGLRLDWWCWGPLAQRPW